MTEPQDIDVKDSRKRPRFNMRTEINAAFSGIPVVVTNLSAEGVGLSHDTPIKINSAGSMRIDSEENTTGASFRCRVRWSRMSRAGAGETKHLYLSGLHIEEASDAAAGLLGRLIQASGERDVDSMQNKRNLVLGRKQARTNPEPAAPKPEDPKITSDQVLLVRGTNTNLADNPDAVAEWYERGKLSLVKRGLIRDEKASSPYRREVIAIWEYLGGKIDLDVITMVLDAEKQSR